VREIKSIAKDIALDRKQQDIFKWLSTLSPSDQHLEIQKIRVEGTGTWLLEDPEFVLWSSNTPKCRTFCCYGVAGAGKTVISIQVLPIQASAAHTLVYFKYSLFKPPALLLITIKEAYFLSFPFIFFSFFACPPY
jgi:hypothetical protein